MYPRELSTPRPNKCILVGPTSKQLSASNIDRYLKPLPVFALYVLFNAVLHEPASAKSGEYMEVMSIVVESTVQGMDSSDSIIADKHLTHFVTFFARTARMAIKRAKIGELSSTYSPQNGLHM